MVRVAGVAVSHPTPSPGHLVEQLPHVVVLHGGVDGDELGVGVVVAAPRLRVAPAQLALPHQVAEAGPKCPTLWADLQQMVNHVIGDVQDKGGQWSLIPSKSAQ